MPVTRRSLLVNSAAVALTTPSLLHAVSQTKQDATPSVERIGLGIIGPGHRGARNLREALKDQGTELVAVCDVQSDRCDGWLEEYPEATGYLDYRELLADPRVDAVIIATPPHWHCLQAVEAAEAGKHIYLQKPATLYPGEAIAVRNAVREHQVISQIGTQIHQSGNYRRVVEWIQSGRLGPIGRVETFWGWNRGNAGIGTAPSETAPDTIDFDRWCGPAPLCSFNRSLVHNAAMHCSWMDYSGGWTPGMAPHLIDLPVWALELGLPTQVSSMGGRYIVEGDGDAPDTQDIIWQYPNMTMRWHFSITNHYGYEFGSGARQLGVYFHGLNGTLRSNYHTHEITPQNRRLMPESPPEESLAARGTQEQEWLDCIRNGTEPSCNAAYHFNIDLPITLANLSMKIGRTLHFDPETEQIIGDAEATRLAIPEYRTPWEFPTKYLNTTPSVQRADPNLSTYSQADKLTSRDKF